MTLRAKPAASLPPIHLEGSREDAEVRRFVESGELRMGGAPPYTADAAIADARQQWQKEEAARLADAEVVWGEKYDKRLSIARIAAQRAESALGQVQHELARTQADLAAREKDFAELRALYDQERERWKQSPAAAQKQQAERDLQFERRLHIGLRLTRDLALFAFVLAASVFMGERAAPIVASMLRQETGAHSHVRPLLEKAGVPLPAADVGPQALVSTRTAKLRAKPDTGAPVIGRLWRNESVALLARNEGWVLVRIGTPPHQQQGWVATSALRPVNAPISAAR